MSARVVLADHSAPSRAGLRVALGRAGFEIAGEAADAEELLGLEELAAADLAVVAAELPGGGLRAVRQLSQRHPRMRAVVLTAAPDDEEMIASVMAGASGYLPREVAIARLPTIMDAVLRGEAALPRSFSGRLLDELRVRTERRRHLPPEVRARLSSREWDVLEDLGDGRRTAEIAKRLGISEVTVRRHISALVSKLGVRGRSDLVRLLSDDTKLS